MWLCLWPKGQRHCNVWHFLILYGLLHFAKVIIRRHKVREVWEQWSDYFPPALKRLILCTNGWGHLLWSVNPLDGTSVDANDVTGTLVKAGSQLFFCERASQIQYCQEHFTMWGLIPLVSAEDGTCLSVCLSLPTERILWQSSYLRNSKHIWKLSRLIFSRVNSHFY